MIKNDNTLFCFRCYHIWKKRKEKSPKYCPNSKCHSPYWNKPRKKIPQGMVLKMEEMIINIHNTIIKLSGGERGVREEGGIYNSTYKLLNHHSKIQYKEATKFIIEVAKYDSKITFDEIKQWLSENCIYIKDKDVENYLNKTALNLMLGDSEYGN